MEFLLAYFIVVVVFFAAIFFPIAALMAIFHLLFGLDPDKKQDSKD